MRPGRRSSAIFAGALLVLVALWPVLAAGAPTAVTQFEGLTNSDNASLRGITSVPPDDNLAVGPSHVFQTVNGVGRFSDKLGRSVSSFTLRSFFNLDSGFSEADPRVIYDARSSRWFATYFQFSTSLSSSSIVLAVSTSSDVTGSFCRYRIGNSSSETFQQDFPMIGVSDDKIVVSYNGFNLSTGSFIGGGFYVINKSQAMACSTINFSIFAPNLSRSTLHPAHSLSSTNDLFMVQNNTSTLSLVRVSGLPPALVTASTSSLGIRTWSAPPKAPQAGSSVTLDASDGRVLSAAWQSNSLWLTGSEACTPSGDTAARSCLRVIEVKTDTTTVRQDMTFGTAGKYYYYPALRPDSSGNLYVVFNRSSSVDFPGVWITGRQASDALNTLQPAVQLRAGGGAQTGSSRMGDYSGVGVDPSDPTTVWVTAEYIRSTEATNWGTSIAQLTFVSQATGRSPAVASWAPERLDVFMRGPDNTLRHKFFQGAWSDWENLGGFLLSDPGVVSWGFGRIDIFVRGADDAVWHLFYDNGWGFWESLGGATNARPVVASWVPGRLDVFIRGTDGQMWHKFFQGGWSPWEPLGGGLVSEPATVSFGFGRIDVFAQGSDNALYHKFFDFANPGWFDWHPHGGVISSAPAVSSWGSGRLDVFARGSDGNLWHLLFDNALTSNVWEGLGDAIASAPAAVSWESFRIDLFAGRADSTLLHKWFNGTWNSEVMDAPQ